MMRLRSSLCLLGALPRKSMSLLTGAAALSCKCTGAASCNTVPSLLSSEEALNLFNCKGSKFVDGTWILGKGSMTNDFANERIPGAQFFDIDKIADTSNPLPHMLPSAEVFAEAVSAMGISNDDHVIVYTQPNSFSWARVWWTFRAFGHPKVSVLNGGLGAWRAASGPTESGPVTPVPRTQFSATLNKDMVASWQDVLRVVDTGSSQILDARSLARYLAQAPEPRPGLAGGHIPGSLSLPFTELVNDQEFSQLKTPAQIRDAFVKSGFIMGSDAILSCGSGVTAAVLCFGLHMIGKELSSTKVYDGSWSEWGARDDLPRMPETK